MLQLISFIRWNVGTDAHATGSQHAKFSRGQGLKLAQLGGKTAELAPTAHSISSFKDAAEGHPLRMSDTILLPVDDDGVLNWALENTGTSLRLLVVLHGHASFTKLHGITN